MQRSLTATSLVGPVAAALSVFVRAAELITHQKVIPTSKVIPVPITYVSLVEPGAFKVWFGTVVPAVAALVEFRNFK